MKKTLIAFSVTVMLAITLLLGIGLTGCDWFNKNVLGKQTQQELEAIGEQQKDHELDSIRQAALAKSAELEAKDKELAEQSKNVNKPYHIIVGAFEEQENVDNMVALFKSHGYNTQTFRMDYLTCVSAISFETVREAETALQNMLELDYCPEDAWVYKR